MLKSPASTHGALERTNLVELDPVVRAETLIACQVDNSKQASALSQPQDLEAPIPTTQLLIQDRKSLLFLNIQNQGGPFASLDALPAHGQNAT